MTTTSIRVLVAEDFEPFRRFLSAMLQNRPNLRVICEVLDGFEAVQKAEELKPDLILLDIGLPKLNGIEAARRIRKLSPKSKILFLSQESSADVVQAALDIGARGYLVKTDARSELLTAVDAVVRGERFIGGRFAGHNFTEGRDSPTPESVQRNRVSLPLPEQTRETAHRHEVEFYSDDECLLNGFTQFIWAALKAGNAVIVVATESHRDKLLPRLQAHGLDIGAAIEQGRYISLDAADTLAAFMVNDLPDPVRFLRVVSGLIMTAAKAAKGEHVRVAACGECAPLLWMQGNAEAAIRLEQLWDGVAKSYDVDVLCGYSLGSFQGGVGSPIFEKICAEHSAAYSQ